MIFRDSIYVIIVWLIPFIIANEREFINNTEFSIVILTSATLLLLGIIPFILTGKCFLNGLFTKRPIRTILKLYGKNKIIYIMLLIILFLIIENYIFVLLN
jgi:hypothetical protein